MIITRDAPHLLRASLLSAFALVVVACSGGDTTAPVVAAPVSTVVFTTEPSQFMVKGATQQLTAVPRDANGASLTGRTITWASTNTSVATVSSTGLVTAIASGLTSISATSEGRAASFPLRVSESVGEVSVTADDDIFEAGSTRQLTVRVRDGSGASIVNPTIAWSSAKTSVATVSASGLLTINGTDNDSIVVTATVGGKSGTFRFFAWPSLTNDVATTVNGTLEESRWFLFRVAPGTTRLTITTTGGTGDADLFVWSPGTWAGATQMCESITPTATERCVLESPQPGLWSVELFGYSAFDNVQVKAVRQ